MCDVLLARLSKRSLYTSCTSGEDLVNIMTHMRQAAPMPDELWEKLSARAVASDNGKDARLHEQRFLDGHECGLKWQAVSRLQHMRAKRDACRNNQRLYLIQAVDTVLNAAPFNKKEAFESLTAVSATKTIDLMGMVPLFVGMRVKLSDNDFNLPLDVKDETGVVMNIQFHPNEKDHSRSDRNPILFL